MPTIRIIETPGLGDRSYLAHDGTVAVVVDPQRDIDRVLAVAGADGVRVTHVFETHIHNDYVTGGLALARATGAAYLVAAADQVAFERVPVRPGDVVRAGALTVTAVATPGHTRHHLSYVLAADGAEPVAVFTGGSMLFGSVGRTDLIDPTLTEPLAREQYRSVRRLAASLPSPTAVLPTHGFGSFCAGGETFGTESSIGREAAANAACTAGDEDGFVRTLMAGFVAHPGYYAHMAPVNRCGPDAADLTFARRLPPSDLAPRIARGEWVVDLRPRLDFARSHRPGSVSVELCEAFATYLGWTMPWGTPLSLLAEADADVADAQRQLVRIGVDRLEGVVVAPVPALVGDAPGSYRTARFDDLVAASGDGLVVLDVRRRDEWDAGHLVGALHVPFWELEARMGELPPGEVWVHCAAGFRAAIAASLLDRAGRRVVHVDDQWARVEPLGLPVTA